jgi:hypothetical protein
MSSRSLAAARARRAGENAPPVSGNRPGTSIGSHAAFAQQMPPNMSYNMPPPPNNVRVGRGQPIPSQQQQAYQQVKQSQQQVQNGLPFTKLSISDAIGLITLRLGRVEQWVIETEHESESKEESTYDNSNLPQNSKIVDNSVFSSIINRLEAVEKNEPVGVVNNELVTKLSEDVSRLTEQLTRIGDEGVKHSLAIAKHTEQLFKFERELVETKDILKTFMIKYDLFATDTNDKFADYEFALSELEKNIKTNVESNVETSVEKSENDDNEEVNDSEEAQINDVDTNETSSSIMTVNLKNIIKQELANSV